MIRAVAIALAALAVYAAPAAAGEPDATAPAYDVALRGSDRGRHWSGRETIAFTNPVKPFCWTFSSLVWVS